MIKLNSVVASNKFSTTHCAINKLIQLINIVGNIFYVHMSSLIHGLNLQLTILKNVTGPTKAVEIETNSATNMM